MSRWMVVSRAPCGSRLSTTSTVSPGSPNSASCAVLEKTSTWSSSLRWIVTLRSSWSAGCSRRIRLSSVRYGARVRPVGVGGVPVADPDLELLRVEVLLAARLDRDVLEQLVAGVHPQLGEPSAASTARILKAGGPPYCRNACRMSGVLTKKFGRIRWLVSRGHLQEVLLDLPLLRAPGEVRVGLVVADGAEPVHHRRPRERLGQEDHVGVGTPDLAEQLLPERQRLGVRVVDAEDPHAVLHPEPDDAEHLGVDAVVVVVEVDRVDVLVLLRRVLGVGDGAVGPRGEPLGVVLGPGVVGRRLQRQVEGHLEAELAGARHERVEVVEAAEVGVDRVVPAVLGPDRPGRAGVVGPGVRVLFGPLRLTSPIGWIGGR